MNNKEFINELAERTGYSPKDTQKLVDNIINAMGDAFQEDNAVLVPNFGTFEPKKKAGASYRQSCIWAADVGAAQIGVGFQA